MNQHEHSNALFERKSHLLDLEVLVLHASLILAEVVDDNGLLSLVDKLGFDGGVREEDTNHNGPDDCHGTSDPEHAPPLMVAGQESNAPADGTGEADGETSVHEACPNRLLATAVPHAKDQLGKISFCV